MSGCCALIACAMRKRRIDRAGEGYGNQHQTRFVTVDGRQGEFFQRRASTRGFRGGEGACQRFESRLAACQRLGVADELEARVDGVAQHVGEVVEIERCQMPRPVLHAERAEGPGQRIATLVVDVVVERGEARAFGQKLAAADAMAD